MRKKWLCQNRRRGEVFNIPQVGALCCLIAIFIIGAAPPPETDNHIVSADHPLASRAGAKIFFEGGNAVDAAVATALAAGVVQPAGSGLGGGGFAVVYDGNAPGSTRQTVMDFREIAPKKSRQNMYLDEQGRVIPGASRIGAKAVAVPVEGIGLAALVRQKGRMSLKRVAAPAIMLAEKGFPVGAHLAKAISRTKHADVLAFFEKDGRPIRRYEWFRNKALGRTIRRWAASGGQSLQTGSDAALMVDTVARLGGELASKDLAQYSPAARNPIISKYKGYTIITMPPPSSGGVVLGQVLQVLETVDFGNIPHNSSRYIHLVTEAMKHAYADRAHHMGDPDFIKVPTERLLSAERIEEVRNKFDPNTTHDAPFYGALIAPLQDGGTQHISVQSADMGVALTTTINTSFGSGIVVPDLGLILNNEMDDFSSAPGVKNAYGLIGSEANAIQPGKRPLSSMTPTVVLDDNGRLYMVLGASGGSTIISSCIQVFLNIVEFGMDPQAAVSAPRFHHQWIPEELYLEPEFADDVVKNLEGLGHTVMVRRAFSSVQVTVNTDDDIAAGADPRKGGWPASTRMMER